jgi:hypothetical protein
MEDFLKNLPAEQRCYAYGRDFLFHVVSIGCMEGVTFCLDHHIKNCTEGSFCRIIPDPRGTSTISCCQWIQGGMCRAAQLGNFRMFNHLMLDTESSPITLTDIDWNVIHFYAICNQENTKMIEYVTEYREIYGSTAVLSDDSATVTPSDREFEMDPDYSWVSDEELEDLIYPPVSIDWLDYPEDIHAHHE